MTRLLLALSLLCGLAATTRAQTEMRDPVSTIAIHLSPDLPAVGDFALIDKGGEVFGLGRFLVSFKSVYDALAKGNTAQGECEFVYVPYKGGKPGPHAVHHMRYWFDFDKSVVRLNTDVDGEEIRLEFEFNLTREFTQGTIRKGMGETSPEAGTCRVRITDGS